MNHPIKDQPRRQATSAEHTVYNEVTVNFTMVGNDALRDERLSWGATGLLAYMLSHTGKWRFRSDSMKRSGYGSGRDAVRRMMRELEACGYLTFDKRRDEHGQISQAIVVHYPPITSPGPETPAPVRPAPVKPALIEDQLPASQVEEDHPKNTINYAPAARTPRRRQEKTPMPIAQNPDDTRTTDVIEWQMVVGKPPVKPPVKVKRSPAERARVVKPKAISGDDEERPGEQVYNLATAFRTQTLQALALLGDTKMAMLAFNRKVMMSAFKKLKEERGTSVELLYQLVDQWRADIECGNIRIPPDMAPWRVFLARLDEIHGRLQDKQHLVGVTTSAADSFAGWLTGLEDED